MVGESVYARLGIMLVKVMCNSLGVRKKGRRPSSPLKSLCSLAISQAFHELRTDSWLCRWSRSGQCRHY